MITRPGLMRLSPLMTSMINRVPFNFVFEMRRVDGELQLIVPGRKINVPLQHFDFISAVLVQADFADAQYGGAIQEIRNDREDIVGKFEVLGFLRVDAQPAEVRGRPNLAARLGSCSVNWQKIIVKTIRRNWRSKPAQKALRFGKPPGNRPWPCGHLNHPVRDAADHVGMRLDVTHLVG